MKTKVLLDAINIVLPGTNVKGLVSGTDMIVIINGEFTAYNDRISVSTFVDDPGLMIECAINANDFKNIIKGIKESEVDLSMGDNILSIVSENTEAEIPVTSDIESILNMIKNLKTSELEFDDLPTNFSEGLKLTRFNVSDDYSHKHNLFCLCLKNDYIYTADDFRLSRYQLNSTVKGTFLIPRNNLADLYNFNPNGIAKTSGWVHFINAEDAIFSCRIVIGEYPVTESMFDTEKGTKVELPAGLKEILTDITSLYDEVLNAYKAVKLKFDGDRMFCEIEKDKIWVKKTLDLYAKSPTASFTLSSVFLAEILNYTTKITVTNKQAIFSTDNFKHQIMLQSEV